MKSGFDAVFELEKKISDRKFLERDLIKERDVVRMNSLDRAERSPVIEGIIKNVFLSELKADRKDIVLHSFQSKLSGRGNEEFLSEVKIEIRYKPENFGVEYSEIAMAVYLEKGFQDGNVQANEVRIMDRLVALREEVELLKDEKRKLKKENK